MNDSRGKKSWTVLFVFITWMLINIKFMLAGLNLSWGTVPAMGITEYSTAFMMIMGIWLGREAIDTQRK